MGSFGRSRVIGPQAARYITGSYYDSTVFSLLSSLWQIHGQPKTTTKTRRLSTRPHSRRLSCRCLTPNLERKFSTLDVGDMAFHCDYKFTMAHLRWQRRSYHRTSEDCRRIRQGDWIRYERKHGMLSSSTSFRLVPYASSAFKVKKAQENGLKSCFVCDAQSLKFPVEFQNMEGQFDAVFSNATLHWCKQDPQAAILSAKRALKPGGRFVAEMGGFMNCIGMSPRCYDFMSGWISTSILERCPVGPSRSPKEKRI